MKSKNIQTKEQKISSLKEFLDSKNISYNSDYWLESDTDTVFAEVEIPTYKIVVSTDEEHSEYIFHTLSKFKYRAFFVRESEKIDFILEKMANCISSIIEESEKLLWKKVGYGERHRHRPDFDQEELNKEFLFFVENGMAIEDVIEHLKIKYKAFNASYFQHRSDLQKQLEKEHKFLKKALLNNPSNKRKIQKKYDKNFKQLMELYRRKPKSDKYKSQKKSLA